MNVGDEKNADPILYRQNMSATYHIFFRCPKYPPNPVETVIDSTLSVGSDATGENGDVFLEKYLCPQHDHVSQSEFDIEEVIEDINEDEVGTLYVSFYGSLIPLNFLINDPDPDTTRPTFDLAFESGDLRRIDTEHIAAWVGALSEAFDVEYAFFGSPSPDEFDFAGSFADELRERGQLPWIVALPPEAVADLGGREHVLATPTWLVEELDTGHVLIVKTESLGGDGDVVDKHLFER